MEVNEKFEDLKKEYNIKFDISFSDEDIMDIGGHGQTSKVRRIIRKNMRYSMVP
jgi:hypothetical protein